MNQQLVRIVELLNKHKIHYWLEGGTLLGLIRQGDVISYDDDIDVDIWAEDVDKLKPIIEELKSEYKVNKGLKYAPDSTNLEPKKGFPITIHHYHRNKTHAYCFMQAIRPLHIKKWTVRWIIWIAPHLIYNLVAKVNGTADPDLHPLGKIKYFIGERVMFRFPLVLIEETCLKSFNNLKARIPRKYEEYLTFRYGDWRIPNKNWDVGKDGSSVKLKDLYFT
jgi:phosphorylcholine metabolism protein LicD